MNKARQQIAAKIKIISTAEIQNRYNLKMFSLNMIIISNLLNMNRETIKTKSNTILIIAKENIKS